MDSKTSLSQKSQKIKTSGDITTKTKLRIVYEKWQIDKLSISLPCLILLAKNFMIKCNLNRFQYLYQPVLKGFKTFIALAQSFYTSYFLIS